MGKEDRMAAWDEPSPWATNPMSPAKREAHRVEMQRKIDRPPRLRHTQQPGSLSPASKRHNRIEEARLWVDAAALAHVALDNQLPTAHASRNGCALASNTLRFERDVEVGQSVPHNGGRLFGPTTLEANWVEEKRDRHFLPGWHAKELRRNKLWDTEHTSAYSVAVQPKYAAAILPTQLVAAPSSVTTHKVKLDATSGHGSELFQYAQDGFGCGPFQDHTAEPRRGSSWVGIAPVLAGKESVCATVHGRQQPLEFQVRDANEDPKATLLGPHPATALTPQQQLQAEDMWRTKARVDLAASQRYTACWQSTYNTDFGVGQRMQPHGAPAMLSLRPRTSLL